MEIENLDLKHKEFLHPILKSFDTRISEYSFANLYLFRNTHQYELVKIKNYFIKGKTYDGLTYLMPLFNLNDIEEDVLLAAIESVDFLFPVAEKWLNRFDSEKFNFIAMAGDSDYLYCIEKIRTFAGKKLHGKRNLLHQFEKNYSCVPTALYGEKKIEDALYVLNQWQEDAEQKRENTDFYACLEALKLYDELTLCGFIYYIENKPVGFIIGEELTGDTFALHFAKAIVSYKGIYQYIFSNFAKILPDKYKYVNFEQDLDNENLRQTKKSYEPDIILKKYRVSKKRQIFQ